MTDYIGYLREFPSDFFQQYRDLEHLHLESIKRYDGLTTLPREIGQLQNLQSLTVKTHGLTSLPREIGQLHNLQTLDLSINKLAMLPTEIGQLHNLETLNIRNNHLISLPTEIGQLQNLQTLDTAHNKLLTLPYEIGQLQNLQTLDVWYNNLGILPPTIGQLKNLKYFYLSSNKLTTLPPEIGQLKKLKKLDIANNKLTTLPPEIGQLHNLEILDLNVNPIQDLSALANHPNQNLEVRAFGVKLPRQYWTHLSQWKAEWLLTEKNAEIRRLLIQKIGYERICEELQAVELDCWREYTLLKIDADVDIEPIHLLKMTCPSTNHIHVLRVPPNLTSAREAISWVNWDIDPEVFATET